LDFLFFFSGLFIWEPLEAEMEKKGTINKNRGEAVAVRPKPKF